jgi:hypothetical protein
LLIGIQVCSNKGQGPVKEKIIMKYKNGEGSFKNLHLNKYETRKADIYRKTF